MNRDRYKIVFKLKDKDEDITTCKTIEEVKEWWEMRHDALYMFVRDRTKPLKSDIIFSYEKYTNK